MRNNFKVLFSLFRATKREDLTGFRYDILSSNVNLVTIKIHDSNQD